MRDFFPLGETRPFFDAFKFLFVFVERKPASVLKHFKCVGGFFVLEGIHGAVFFNFFVFADAASCSPEDNPWVVCAHFGVHSPGKMP